MRDIPPGCLCHAIQYTPQHRPGWRCPSHKQSEIIDDKEDTTDNTDHGKYIAEKDRDH